jgi:predicted ATPase
MIKQAFFSNFRALRNVDVPLGPLTVIVGPNASGKTTILKGLQYLLELVRVGDPLRFSVGERHPLLLATRGAHGKTGVGVQNNTGTVSVEFRVPPDLSFESFHQRAQQEIDWKFSLKSTRNPAVKWVDIQQDRELIDELPEPKLLKLEPSHLAAPSNPSMYRPEIDETGEGLASVLAVLYGRDYATFKRLEQHLCTVVPSVRQIRIDRVPTASALHSQPGLLGFGGQGIEVGETLLFDTVSASGIPSSCMSDGTLLVLGLLTVLYTSKRTQLILLDDLEHGLHPKAQREIVPLIRDLLKKTPNLQIVATTHSPYLVDVLDPEEVRITTLTDEGEVKCRSLDLHPEFDRWKDEMSPGEFWSAVGEKWISAQPAGKQ